jgi:hypothetical protein
VQLRFRAGLAEAVPSQCRAMGTVPNATILRGILRTHMCTTGSETRYQQTTKSGFTRHTRLQPDASLRIFTHFNDLTRYSGFIKIRRIYD